ncbi:MAG: sigma-70 family RNA polymerase sigma factor [Armatimonadota bacterium]|jgi:RNA polymerase sigma-70 factor (ECF subfamily)
MSTTDLELLGRYADARDAEAFADLVARHRDMVYAACYRILGSRADAEDSTQECFLHLARNAQSVTMSVAGWLHRVAVNTSITLRRKDHARRRTEREAAGVVAHGSAEPSWDDVKVEIDKAINRLPDTLREPLVLHFLQGAPQTAIAEHLGVSQPAVSKRIKKGIEGLRRHLERAGLIVSAAGLSALLTGHAVEAAPAALTAELGKIALAGIRSSPPGVSAAGQSVGLGAFVGAQTKTAAAVAAALVAAVALQQTMGDRASPGGEPAMQAQALLPAQASSAERTVPSATPRAHRAAQAHRLAASPSAPREESPRVLTGASGGDGADIKNTPDAAPDLLAQAAPAAPPPTPADQAEEVALPPVETIRRPGVKVLYEPGLGDELIGDIADVVSAAKSAIEEIFPDRRLPEIDLVITRGAPWRENVVTNRRNRIYVSAGEQGIGEAMRADAGPVAILCEAVAELYNTLRIPGLKRFVAHRYLVPAAMAQVGPFAVQVPHPTLLAVDEAEMLATLCNDGYTLVHPDFAAVAALMAVEAALGPEGLRDLLAAIPEGTQAPVAALREGAVKAAPGLAAAFASYDEAVHLEPDADGSCLVTSAEADEVISAVRTHPLRTILETAVLVVAPQAAWSQTEDWATHGTQSLKLELDADTPWMYVHLIDPDWQFKDWQRFSQFEMDLRLDSPTPQRIWVCAHDHPTCGHGMIDIFSDVLQPGEQRHIAYPLTEETLRGHKSWTALYFDGAFRADSVSRLSIGVSDPRPPITIYLDNVRLTPRAEAEADTTDDATAPPPPAEVPAPATAAQNTVVLTGTAPDSGDALPNHRPAPTPPHRAPLPPSPAT